MPEQKHTVDTRPQRDRRRVRPDRGAEPDEELVAPEKLPTPERQAVLLSDGRFPARQRQVMAAQIGQINGNRRLQRMIARTSGRSAPASAHAERVIQRGLWSSARRGASMYWNMSDEGASFARELMRWRMIGLGRDFVMGDPTQWSDFMIARPEIQRAMAVKFRELVRGFAAAGPGSGRFTSSIRDVRLNELESMRLTLHGCHRIDISGEYEVTEERPTRPGAPQTMTAPRPAAGPTVKIVRLSNVRFVWVDRADLHPGISTELASGETVGDEEFTGAGWNYNIRIPFLMPSVSTWSVSGSTTTHQRGWPPITGAPAAGFRG